jgi:DNA-binding NarL/FixJ family response regulator
VLMISPVATEFIAYDLIKGRNAISGLLQNHGFTVSTFTNGKEMIEQMHCMQTLPDVCIVNVNMPHMNGYATTRYIRKNFTSVKVIVYSMSNYDMDIIYMFGAGASSYLVKNGDIEELVLAIKTIHEKGVYLNEGISKVVLQYLQRIV